MSGAHVDEWWPQDGPSRNGRMAWPPYVGTHRADRSQPVKDVWSGNPETDKFWAKNEPVNENFD